MTGPFTYPGEPFARRRIPGDTYGRALQETQHMKSGIISAIPLIAFLWPYALPLKAQSDSAEAARVIMAERRGWELMDSAEATRYYSDDVYWINAWGIERIGRTAVQGFVGHLFRQPGYRSTRIDKPFALHRFRLYAPGLAWMHGSGEISGQVSPAGVEMAPRHTHIFYLLRKEAGEWRIVSFEVMDEKERVR